MLSLAELVKEVLIAPSGMVSFHRTIFNYSLGDLDGLHDHISYQRCSMGINRFCCSFRISWLILVSHFCINLSSFLSLLIIPPFSFVWIEQIHWAVRLRLSLERHVIFLIKRVLYPKERIKLIIMYKLRFSWPFANRK